MLSLHCIHYVIVNFQQLFQEKTNSQGKFTNLNALIDYETTWHKSIYEYAKTNLTKEVHTSYHNYVSLIDFIAGKLFL